MNNLKKNKTIEELERATELKLTKGFFDMGKALYKIKQNRLFSDKSFSVFCKKFPGLPGEKEESKRLLAFQMVKIYIELHLNRSLSRSDILVLGFNKAYDLSRFSSTHTGLEFKAMQEKAGQPNYNKFRKLLINQYAGAVRKEITTAYYDSKGKLIDSYKRIVEL